MAGKVLKAVREVVKKVIDRDIVLVRNTKPRAHSINSVALGKKITLKPGINAVKTALWNWAKEQITVQHYVDCGDLEEIKETLENLSPVRALQMVKETFSREVLDAWLQEETREKIIEAINEQIKAL